MVLGYKFGGCSDGDVFLFLLGLERDCVRERSETQRKSETERKKASDLRVQS